MSGGSIFVYIHRPIHSIQPMSSSSVSQSSITPAPKPAKLKNMKIQTKPNYCKNLIRHDHRPIIRMIHLGKDAAGQFLAKTLSWANYQRARVPGTFCSQGSLSHRDLIPSISTRISLWIPVARPVQSMETDGNQIIISSSGLNQDQTGFSSLSALHPIASRMSLLQGGI